MAIYLAKKGAQVTATDINKTAIEVAKNNAKKANVNVSFIYSDLFENISNKFDIIVFNPPYVPTEENEAKDMQSVAWDGGKDGLEVIQKFLHQAKSFLNFGGKIILLVSSRSETPPHFSNFKSKILKKKSFFFERLFVLELLPL